MKWLQELPTYQATYEGRQVRVDSYQGTHPFCGTERMELAICLDTIFQY